VFIVVHIVALFITRTIKHNHTPIIRLIQHKYLHNNVLLISLLLEGWLVCYCLVSWIIWFKFERSERVEPDAYMPVISDATEEGDCIIGMKVSKEELEGSMVLTPALIVQLPDGDYILGSGGDATLG
jgi:hypothetical protein